jgi:hypothetical protein
MCIFLQTNSISFRNLSQIPPSFVGTKETYKEQLRVIKRRLQRLHISSPCPRTPNRIRVDYDFEEKVVFLAMRFRQLHISDPSTSAFEVRMQKLSIKPVHPPLGIHKKEPMRNYETVRKVKRVAKSNFCTATLFSVGLLVGLTVLYMLV